MSKPIRLTKDNYDEFVKNSGLSIVDYGATWCGPCKKYEPIFEELAEKFENKVVVAKVDIGEQPAIAQENGVMSVPTVIIYQNGKVVDRIVGVVPAGKLVEKLNKLIGN